MIALQRMQPEPPPRRSGETVERTRAATKRRFARAQRRGYLAFMRVAAVVAVVVVPLMLYVTLTANLTSLNYALARVQAQKTALLAQTMRQDDRIAKLESRERLAAVAAQLKMRDPQVYAIVTIPAQDPPEIAEQRGIPLLGSVGQWLGSAVGGPVR